jgi:hypothetical protein
VSCSVYRRLNLSSSWCLPFVFTTTLALLLCFAGTAGCPAARAQTSDNGAPDMSGVTDVTGGMKYLLRNDDIAILQVEKKDSAVTTSLLTFDTSNSKTSKDPQKAVITRSVSNGTFDSTAGIVASEAIGRMFNTKSDIAAVLNAVDNSDTPPLASHAWLLTLLDPLTGFRHTTQLSIRFQPQGKVYTQLLMGDFNGDSLSDTLAFYASDHSSTFEWGLKVLTAADPKVEGQLREGAELYGNTELRPVTGSIVVGDFNGDGRDEIAALLSDYQTIAFYAVDPKTLEITQTSTVKLTANDSPVIMVPGQAALTAGRFRNQSPSSTNADLAVFGQIHEIGDKKAKDGYSVIPILITPNTNSNGTFTTQVVQQANGSADDPFFRFNDKHHSDGALAQAAALASWPQQVNEQLVLGIRTADDAGYIEIGSFAQNNKLDTFVWNSETERRYEAGVDSLQNMWVGNFDNGGSSHNPALQIETYEIVFGIGGFGPHVNIFDVHVPNPLPGPGEKHSDWLKQVSDNTSGIPLDSTDLDNSSPPRLDILVPGDMQGRSLRLGAPTIVRIPKQIQPDLVLSIPPMHVDYIYPTGISDPQTVGCENSKTLCLLNVSVRPSVPPSNGTQKPFATQFLFDASSSSSAKQSSTTSWGISVQQSVGASFSFNDGEENASASIKNTTKTAHDETVSKTYNTYKGTTQQLTATTGFADHIFYTQKEMNVYYYPVLGCDSNGTECTKDNTTAPTYVEFSVPDRVTYNNVDGYLQDWYQPVHESGNVLSYPWNQAQLALQFSDKVSPLTRQATCMANDQSQQTANTTWNQGQSNSSSSGSTSSFSDELSMSYSEGIGISGVDSANINYSLDVGAHTSLNTLNESISSLSSSQGITITKPDFGYTSLCCTYGFGQYIFGLEGKAHTPAEGTCKAGQTSGCVPVNDPDGKPVGVAGTGPLFTGYVASPLNNDPNNKELTCSGNQPWWQGVYNQPDIAVNHPERWFWDGNAQKVELNKPDRTYPAKGSTVPVDQQFYTMKGFYISKKDSQNTPLTLSPTPLILEARPSDQLTLSARIYNYSLVDTPANATIHVRFYGQPYCSSGSGTTETSCINWNNHAACSAGDLCGNSFLIGDQTIQQIAGFESLSGNGAPNWKLASQDFLPASFPATKNGNGNMVFWVATWMEDGSGKLAEEMPDHGLNSIPAAGLTQITQVDTQEYSNNVGMYPVHQFFHLLPVDSPSLGATEGSGALQNIHISTASEIPLGRRAKIEAMLQANAAPVRSVNVAYFDGDPAKNGKMFDFQTIAYMEPQVSYYHRSFFAPSACGVHTIFTKAWVNGSSTVQASTSTTVTLQLGDFLQALIDSTRTAYITDAALKSSLLQQLNLANVEFQQGRNQSGQDMLRTVAQRVNAASGSGMSADTAGRLAGQINVLLGCNPINFSLAASPDTATVNAGSSASYTLSITPIGGFTGNVLLSCSGAPSGSFCVASPSSVAVNGAMKATVIITTAGPSVSTSGMAGPPPTWRRRVQWMILLGVVLLTTAWFQRQRVKYTVVCGVLGLTFFLNGCGQSILHTTTPAGSYPITVTASSGAITQNMTMTLVVK